MTELVFKLACDPQVLGRNVLGRFAGIAASAAITVVTGCVALLAVVTMA